MCTCVSARFSFFSAGGDPLLCQLFPMMLNSNRNIVSGENDFILWKTILPHSFISPRWPLSPLNPNSSCYSLLYSLYLYQCLPLYISGSLVLSLFYVHDSFSFSCRFSLFLSEAPSVCFKGRPTLYLLFSDATLI